MDKPTDQDILDVVASGRQMMTYVVRNVLARERKFKGLKTDFVRRRLMAMEKAGKVKRMPTSYVVQVCWGIASEASQ